MSNERDLPDGGEETVTRPVRKKIFYGWWILVFSSLITVIGLGIPYYSFTVFFLPLKRDLVLSSAAVSLIFGAGRLEDGAEGPLIGYLIALLVASGIFASLHCPVPGKKSLRDKLGLETT